MNIYKAKMNLQNLSVIIFPISSRNKSPNASSAKGKTTIGGRAEMPITPSNINFGPSNFSTADLSFDLKALVLLKKAPVSKNRRWCL